MLVVLARWPAGDYALPMTAYGCPVQDGFSGWLQGLAVFTSDAVTWSPTFDLRGPLAPTTWSLGFCSRLQATHDDEEPPEQPPWPRADYCVYKIADNCPSGTLIRVIICLQKTPEDVAGMPLDPLK